MKVNVGHWDFHGLELPAHLYENCIDLSSKRSGYRGIGWYYSDALEFIDILNKSSYAVLGGDTYYDGEGEEFFFAIEYSWYIKREDLTVDELLLKRNQREAVERLTQFEEESKRNGKKLVYRISSGSLEWLKKMGR